MRVNVAAQVSGKKITTTMVDFRHLNVILQDISRGYADENSVLRYTTLYMNKGAQDTLSFVEGIAAEKRYVLKGAPGAGKTSIWWVAACRQSRTYPQKTFVCVWAIKGAF